ncbi:MAG: hypothetical protein KJ040_00075 [Gammaproteobacteria bacterium]|nr:hypothetical protein [Gammaproteobacteria bacterium]
MPAPKRRKPSKIIPPDPPGGSPEQAIAAFCMAAWKGIPPPPRVTQWIADCLAEIENDPNHFARRAFGMTAKGAPKDSGTSVDYLLFVGLARRYGHTLDDAVAHAADVFKKSSDTISKAVRGMRTHRLEGLRTDMMEQALLKHGRSLPLPPGKLTKAKRRTPAKK